MFYLNLQNMYYIKTIVEEGSLSKAAEKLYTTQPNLTRTIKAEEAKIGLPLFNKETTPWSLTYVGQLYIKTAIDFLQTNLNFVSQIENIINGQRGLIKIGLMSFEERYLLPKLLPIIQKKHPNWIIQTIIVSPMEVTSLLYKNLVDFAVIVSEDNSDLISIPLKTYNIMLAIPINHPLAHKYKLPKDGKSFPTIDINLVKNEQFILLANTKLTDYVSKIAFKKFGFNLNKIFTVYSSDSALANVEAGLGATFVLDVIAQDRYLLGRAAFFYLKGFEAKQEITLSYLKGKKLNNIEKSFINTFQNKVF